MLNGKSILITGASGGIGEAIARRCASQGALVGVHYFTQGERAQALAGEIGGVALGFDVRDEAEVARGFEQLVAHAGHVDAVVNAAGVHHAELLVSADPAKIRNQIDVNLLGTITCSRLSLPHLMRRRGGVIVNTSSVAASTPIRGGAVYAATKSAVEALTRALALEYGKKNIRVVCVRPGPTDTSMLDAARALAGDEITERTALRRFAQPGEIAAMVTFLLSDEARFVTGSVHAVDGGFS